MKNELYIKLFKPTLDWFFACIFLIILIPCLLAISIIIWTVDGGPVLFKQERVGQNKRKFWIYKFKTMHNSKGPLLTFDNDHRITKLGKFLRKYKLDELAQLFNILRAQMSFIGPRPEVPIMARQRYNINHTIFSLKPGITGLSSISFIDEYKIMPKSCKDIYEFYIKRILPKKIAIDKEYSDKVSFLLDTKIAIKTILILLRAIFKI